MAAVVVERVVGDEEVAAGGAREVGQQRAALGLERHLLGLAGAGCHHEDIHRHVHGAGDGRHLFGV